MFAAVDSPTALAFLRRYPSPADARGLGEQRLERFLARQHYSVVAVAADSVGGPLRRSTSSIAESEGICTR